MMEERPDVGIQLSELCSALGLPDKTVVAEIHITPTQATVLYYRLNENGEKHIETDGHPSTRWVTMKVRT